jgi:hypothetical protein
MVLVIKSKFVDTVGVKIVWYWWAVESKSWSSLDVVKFAEL